MFNTNAVQRTLLQYNTIEKEFPTNLDTGLWTDATSMADLRIDSSDTSTGEFGALHEPRRMDAHRAAASGAP